MKDFPCKCGHDEEDHWWNIVDQYVCIECSCDCDVYDKMSNLEYLENNYKKSINK